MQKIGKKELDFTCTNKIKRLFFKPKTVVKQTMKVDSIDLV